MCTFALLSLKACKKAAVAVVAILLLGVLPWVECVLQKRSCLVSCADVPQTAGACRESWG